MPLPLLLAQATAAGLSGAPTLGSTAALSSIAAPAAGFSIGGLLSGIGGWMGQNKALTMGIGAMAGQALGGVSTGGAPTGKIKLTKEGKSLETSLYESLKKNKLFPENLASRFIGQAKKIEQMRSRASSRMFQRAASEDVVPGGIAKAMLAEGASRLRGAPEGYRQAGEARRRFTLNRMSQLQNFINQQLQTPVMQAEAALINQELAQARGATQGQALGNIAQLLALSHVYK
jgi:hypothetical protein